MGTPKPKRLTAALPPVDLALAAGAFAGSIALLFAGDAARTGGGGVVALAVALSAAMSFPLAVRRRAPLGVFVITALAAVALRLVADPAGPPIGPTIALFFLAASGDGSRAGIRVTLGAVVALLLAHVAASGIAGHHFPGAELLFGTLLWSATWLAGDRARLRRERMAELEERALRAEREAENERRVAAAEERTKIARDLHDSAGHAINVILVHAGSGRLNAGSDPEAVRRAFGTIEEVARETVREIDQMVGALREAPGGGAEAVEPPGVAALDSLVERHRAAGLEVSTTATGDRAPLPRAVDRSAYRILQEALTNAARHGDGPVSVELGYAPEALDISVVNPVAAGSRSNGGHGLVGMRERAHLLGGTLEAGPRDGRFVLRAHLPLTGQQR